MPSLRRPTSRGPRLVAWWALLAPAGFALDCGGAGPAEPARDARAATSALPGSPSASASASASTAPAEAPPAEAPAATTYPSRLGAKGPTKRTIACGEARCEAGKQACVFQNKVAPGRWACVDANDEVTSDGAFFCDDGSDCEGRQTCCVSFASASSYYRCTNRSGPDSDCAAEACVEGDGAACPPGQVCRDRGCQPKAPARASCGGKRCPAEKPICRWADAARTCLTTGEAQAASEGPAFVEGEFSLYSCTNPADCGQGSQCCTGMVEGARLTRCGRCDVSNSQVVCQRRADCFEICDLFEGAVRDACRKNIKCEGIGRGIKGCSNF